MHDGEPGTAFSDEVVVRRLRFTSEDSGFAVIDAERSGDDVVLVGTLAHLEERERVRIEGTWHDDRRFGMQVKVRLAEPVPPSGEEALIAYLKRVKHIGGGRAARLLERYGDGVLGEIDADPGRAFRTLGLNPKRVNEAIRSWNALRSTRALHLLLAPHGLAWLVPRIAAEYGDRANDVVKSRPYELTSVFGVGFQIADTIARATGIPRDSVGRVRAAVIHVLSEAERAGSTCLPVPELASRAADLLGGPPPDAELLQDMYAAEQIVLEADDEVIWAYRPPTAALEAELAETVRRLARAEPVLDPAAPPEGPPPSAPAVTPGSPAVSSPATTELVPAPEQWAAVEAAFASRLSIVTGGPGTGKTATIRLICAAAKQQRASISLVAPTGRAARRMAESTGMEATTIHSALGWIPGQGRPRTRSRPTCWWSTRPRWPTSSCWSRCCGRSGRDARGARGRRGPARARRRRQAVRGAGRDARGARRRAHAHLPPGRGQHDRPRRARREARRAAAASRSPRTSAATSS